jgi:GNAT superfamily N-acetyltransferase
MLQAALGLTGAVLPAKGQDVRAAARSDLRELEDIGTRADTVFRLAGYALPEIPFDHQALARAKAVFVAGRPPVGFVWVSEVDGLAHVEELAVIPKWMRQGIGSRLLDRACEWARAKGYAAITLTAFVDVPWNGPFYRSHGFVEVDAPTPGLVTVRAREQEVGLDGAGRRAVMRCELGSPRAGRAG